MNLNFLNKFKKFFYEFNTKITDGKIYFKNELCNLNNLAIKKIKKNCLQEKCDKFIEKKLFLTILHEIKEIHKTNKEIVNSFNKNSFEKYENIDKNLLNIIENKNHKILSNFEIVDEESLEYLQENIRNIKENFSKKQSICNKEKNDLESKNQ